MWIGQTSGITDDELAVDGNGSANYSLDAVFKERVEAFNYLNGLLFRGYNGKIKLQNNVFHVTADVGYGDSQAGINSPASTEAEPLSVWSMDTNYVEKNLLESGIPLVANLSAATKEKISMAVKNPGKGIVPASNTSEVVNGLKVLNIMNLGVTGVPFAMLTINKTVRVSRQYASTWQWNDVNKLEVMSKNTFVGKYSVPSWIETIIPNTFSESVGPGIVGNWAYREMRGSYNEAPNNQFSLTQRFVYDRWLADLFTVV